LRQVLNLTQVNSLIFNILYFDSLFSFNYLSQLEDPKREKKKNSFSL
jgi:hypothetical protein